MSSEEVGVRVVARPSNANGELPVLDKQYRLGNGDELLVVLSNTKLEEVDGMIKLTMEVEMR